jgi:N-formylglutamate amidohydrolase
MNSLSVHEPRATETPVVVEVPHAGLEIDPTSLSYCIAPARCLGQDADLFVDELFENAPDVGAHLIFSRMSRYVCDLNRDESDFDEMTCPSGTSSSSPHGVVWRKTTEGRPALSGPVPASEVERRLNMVYRPYHLALHDIIQGKLKKFGVAILLCGHSMPSFGRLGERRADVVPGTQGRTTAGGSVIQICDQVAAEYGYDVAHDTPYRGGFTTSHYGSPGSQVHAVQIELARRLYMDESTLTKNGKFHSCVKFCGALVGGLGRIRR